MGKQKIDQKRFDAVKIMLESGATVPEVERYMGISSWSITRIKKAASFTEYKNMLAAIALEQQERKKARKAVEPEKPTSAHEEPEKEQKPPVAIGSMKENYQLSRLFDEQKKTNELLTSISAKLAYIVEELSGVPAAK